MKFSLKSAAVSLLLAAGLAHAQSIPPQLAASLSVPPEQVLKTLRATFVNTTFTEVRSTPIPGIYEVTMNRDIAYSDATGRYFFFGNVMDMTTQKNITQDRKVELSRVDVSQLKLADAIKTVKGDGSRVLYVFSDPECAYCKRLEPTLAEMTNVTVYTFLFPILGPKSTESAKSVWCAPDRNKAWVDHMLNGVSSPLKAECDTPIQRNLQLGNTFGVTGTPTMVSADGRVMPGALPRERIEAFLNEPVNTANAAKVN